MTVRPSSANCLTALMLGWVVIFCGTLFAQDVPASSFVVSELGPNSPPSDFVFQKRVDEVNLLFTVVDRKGRFINNLKLDDLELLDDKRPPDKVHAFQQVTDLPLRVALVVDMSGSVSNRFKYEQDAAIGFFRKILRPSIDRALVIGFNEKVHFEQDLTNDVTALRRAVTHLKPSGETALFDAVVFAADKLRKDSEKGTRKIIVLISDGDNNSGKGIMNDAEQAALRAESPIYSLSTNKFYDGEYTRGEATLELLSRYTGGELLPAREKGEVISAFRQVEQALRSQYILCYKPAAFAPDGRYRQVALSTRKTKLKVECRHGYFAPKE